MIPLEKSRYAGEPKGAYRPKEFETRYCIGHTKLYEEIAAGRLKARKVGSATVILHEDAEAWGARCQLCGRRRLTHDQSVSRPGDR